MSDTEETMQERDVSTYCYSFEVKMVIQILANNDEHAHATLDGSGGYISRREVKLLKATLVDDEKDK
jgi:hypothetical protein